MQRSPKWQEYDMIYLDEFLVYSRNNRQKSNSLNPFESGAKIVISQFFHLDCMHLWILLSISMLGHKSFVFGWQKKFFLFWNRPGLRKNWETKRCGQHSIMWWIMWNTTQSRYKQNRKTPTHWISTLNIIRRRDFKNKRSSQFWIYT